MSKKWLFFLIVSALTLIVFVLFYFRIQPIKRPEPKQTQNIQIDEPTVSFINPSKGNKEAKITLVEFADFECEPCRQLAVSLEVALKTFPNDIRIVWKNLPNESSHPNATPAAIAAHCADKQGKFWEFHNAIFDRQTFLSDSQYILIAKELNLNEKKFNTCYSEKETLPLVKKDYDEGMALGIVATPTLFIGKESHIGATTTEELIELIQQKLHEQE